MVALDSELQSLQERYDAFELRLQRQFPFFEADPIAPADENSQDELLRHAEEAAFVVARLVQEWPSQDGSADRAALAGRLSALRATVQRVLDRIEERAEALRQARCALRRSLEGLHTGEQFLNSVRGYRENRPKFIDARQ